MKKINIKNKRKFMIFCSILIAVIIFLFVILYINNLWFFDKSQSSDIYDSNGEKIKSSDISKITSYIPQKDLEESLKENYFSEIEELLIIDNFDKLFPKIDENFLIKNGLNENNTKEYLESNEYIGKFPGITSMRYCIQKDGSCVYRLKCFSDSRKEYYVNIIENKPYDYTIDFSQDDIPTVDKKQYTVENENLVFEINEIKRGSSLISFQVKVTNKTDKEIEFFLNNLDDVNLLLEDGGKVQQATSELSSRKYIIKKDSYFIRKFYFPLDMQYHSSVIGMNFYDVRFEDTNKNIRIEF